MSYARLQDEFARARQAFVLIEQYPTGDGRIYVKAAFQTSASRTYVTTIHFDDYPHAIPQVHVTAPALLPTTPHRYPNGKICLLHPSMWNPGAHDLTFVLARTAKWLNKYDIWREKGYWPGAEYKH